MTRVDQFESVFRSADKPVFEYHPLELGRILVVCDLIGAQARTFLAEVRSLLDVLGPAARWELVDGDAFTTTGELLECVSTRRPDLICTYRNLHSEAWRWPHSLGEHLDVLTQTTSSAVLVLPHPAAGRRDAHTLADTDTVMAVTDHLAGDASLVNAAAAFTSDGGTLWLVHVEDERGFERTMDVVSKIDEIDTQTARERIHAQLVKEPADYIGSCRDAILARRPTLAVEEVITVGNHVVEFRGLIEEHTVDLLVMHTKDDEQSAMHGLAYPLAVELREIPLLLL
ncbi:MAG: hypothetical protein CMJ84_18745 [Planctomycetes bacterium]|jgi:hypothetical protein|nr:hypothetical protein [Planctomycetota bacterium]MDP6409751.1 hypothetical protein [Planctomycetota bacterium]